MHYSRGKKEAQTMLPESSSVGHGRLWWFRFNLIGLPGVRFLTGQSGFLAICPVKNTTLNRTISYPVFSRPLKFGQLILSKIIKIVATSCQISRLKGTKFDFVWGSAPDPVGGAYSAPPDPLAGFKGAYF